MLWWSDYVPKMWHLPNIRTHAVRCANPAVRNQMTITVRLDWKVSRIPKHMLKRTAWRMASAATKEAFSMAHKRGEMEWVPTMTLLHQRMFKVPLWSCHVQSKGYSDDVSRRGTFSNFEARSPRAVTDTAFLTAFASSKVMALITNVEPVIHRGWRLTVNKNQQVENRWIFHACDYLNLCNLCIHNYIFLLYIYIYVYSLWTARKAVLMKFFVMIGMARNGSWSHLLWLYGTGSCRPAW